MNECEDCDRTDCRERGCIAPVSSEEIERKALESSGLALWSAYCDKKMELEDAEERIELLERNLERMLLEFDFLVEGGYIRDCRKDIIFEEAREALGKKS